MNKRSTKKLIKSTMKQVRTIQNKLRQKNPKHQSKIRER